MVCLNIINIMLNSHYINTKTYNRSPYIYLNMTEILICYKCTYGL